MPPPYTDWERVQIEIIKESHSHFHFPHVVVVVGGDTDHGVSVQIEIIKESHSPFHFLHVVVGGYTDHGVKIKNAATALELLPTNFLLFRKAGKSFFSLINLK